MRTGTAERPRRCRGAAWAVTFKMRGAETLLPNVFFHAVTAYGILRHNGVELGKMDFLGKA